MTIDEMRSDIHGMTSDIRKALLDNYLLFDLGTMGKGGEQINAALTEFRKDAYEASQRARIKYADMQAMHETASQLRDKILRLAYVHSRKYPIN